MIRNPESTAYRQLEPVATGSVELRWDDPLRPWERFFKRLIDVVASALILLLGLPLWLSLAALIWITSHGPIIYCQKRVGYRGRVFTMFKFRTMYENAEAHSGPVWATHEDPRFTPVGRWLRRIRLDEVPQFWNVLRGEMSLVGPRPERPFFVYQLMREIPDYDYRHRVKPGITGWAQVHLKYDDSLEDVRQKVKYDLFYIENVSLQLDLKIMLKTLRTAAEGKGR